MPDKRRVRRVALTGGIATGKTHVRSRFEALGVPTIDADTLAREAVAPGTPGLNDVVRRFGADIRDATGALDRKKLGAIVFTDADARQTLEGIIHPFVREMTDKWFAELDPSRHPFAIADIPLLFEGRREHDFDKVIVVACDPAAQLQRLMARDGISQDDAQLRIATQLPIEQKIEKADYVIRTDGTFDDTDWEIEQVFDHLQSWSCG
jgi:dephospho-CoA kinase